MDGGINGYADDNAQWDDNSNSVYNADDVSTDEASNDASNFDDADASSSSFRYGKNNRNFDLSRVNLGSPSGIKIEDNGPEDEDDDSQGYMTGFNIFPSHAIGSRPSSPRESDDIRHLFGRPDTPNRGRGRGRGGRSNTPVLDIPCYRDSVSGVTYNRGETVYVENKWPDQPYHVCTIQEFRLSKRDELLVDVKFYFRASEVPENAYQLLVQDRKADKEQSEYLSADPELLTRELFISNASDSFPVSALRNRCTVIHFTSLRDIQDFQPSLDTFFYLLGYNPETKRLATIQGEIRGRPEHMARLPEFRSNVRPDDMPERCEMWEDLNWRPAGICDGDLIMYLRAVRSMAAFAGMCDGGSTEDGCNAASMDETTINALDTLHRNTYDTGQALQELVKKPVPRSIEKKWNEEETKRFVKGLRQFGKNFFRIRKELLPFKETGELVEYYYYWKKTPGAANNRPHRRHRRTNVFRRNNRPPRPPSTGVFCDLSSASEVSDNESDDSDSRDLSGYACRHCFTTTSKDWHHAGKDRALLCTECRVFFKKYGEERPLVDKPEPPPFMFKPVKEEDAVNGKHNMRTRRRKDNGTGKNRPRKDRQNTSSPDNIDSPLNSASSKDAGRKSPSTASTCSSSSTDNKDKEKKNKTKDTQAKNRKRNVENSESDDKCNKKKKSQERSESPIESSTDSSSVCGNDNDENGHDGDLDTNQDDLSSSGSSASSPPPQLNDTEFKLPAPRSPVTNSNTPPPSASVDTDLTEPDTSVAPVLIIPTPKVGAVTEPHLSPKLEQVLPPSDLHIHPSHTAFQQVSSGVSVAPSHTFVSRPLPVPHSTVHSISQSQQGQFPRPHSPGVLTSGSQPLHISQPLLVTPHASRNLTVPPSVPLSGNLSVAGAVATSTSPGGFSVAGGVPASSAASGFSAPGAASGFPGPGSIPASSGAPGGFSLPGGVSVSSGIVLPGGLPVSGSLSVASSLATSSSVSAGLSTPSSLAVPVVHHIRPLAPDPRPSVLQERQTSSPDVQPIDVRPRSTEAPYSGVEFVREIRPSGLEVRSGLPPSIATTGSHVPYPPPPPLLSQAPPVNRAHSPPKPHSTLPIPTLSTAPPGGPPPLAPAGPAVPQMRPPHHNSHPLPPGHMQNHPQNHPPKNSASPPPNLPQPHSQALTKTSTMSHMPHPQLPVSMHAPGGAGIYPPSMGGHRLVAGMNSQPIMSSPYHPAGLMKQERPASPPPLTQPPRSPAGPPGPYPPTRSPLDHHKPHSPTRSRSPLQSQQQPLSSLQPAPQQQQQQQLQGPRPQSPNVRPRSRSPVHTLDSDSEPEPPRSPSPEPRVVNEQCHKSTSAIFIKRLWRGYNTCCRCDFEFRPLPDSKLARKREERLKKASQLHSPTPVAPRPSSHPPPVKEERREEKKEEEKVAVVKAESPNKPPSQKRAETPPSNSSADAQVTSSLHLQQPQPLPPYERHTPGRVPGYPPSHDPTPALRQLSEYARPHTLGQDPSRSLPYSLSSLHPHDPMLHYRMAAMYPPGSRERLELELQRDKQERDERERELRERQLRELEFREKMKQELEMKPPGFDRLLPPGANPLDPHWAAELQRRFGALPPGAGGPHPAGHIPGVYPPASLASDLMRQERERLERLGLASLGQLPPDIIMAERLNAERIHAERMALAMNDPVLRLGLPGAAAAVQAQQAQHAHAHAHAHSHTHLHLHQGQTGGNSGDSPFPPSAGGPPSHPLIGHFPEAPASQSEHARSLALYQYYQRMHPSMDPNLLVQRLMHCSPHASKPPELDARAIEASHLVYHFSRSNPNGQAGAPGSSTPVSPHLPSPHGLPPAHPLVAAAREQELMYRDLLNRPPYSTDPLLAHQLTAQAAAHHEAMQRQLALERDRLGPHLPH